MIVPFFSQKSSILGSDFPWNKPSSYWDIPNKFPWNPLLSHDYPIFSQKSSILFANINPYGS